MFHRDLDSAMSEHACAETHLRHANLALESEVKDLVDRYDREMFHRHRTLDKNRAEYATEKAELSRLLAAFGRVDAQRKAIEAENLAEEERRREQELRRIRALVAAKVIQKAWRAFRARKMLKSKKKRRKKK